MKKNVIIAMISACCLGLFSTSCTNSGAIALETPNDTLSYAAGVVNTEGLIPHITLRMGVDSANIDEVIKGIQDFAKIESDKEKAYVVGLQLGQQIKESVLPYLNQVMFSNDSTVSINEDVFYKAFVKALQSVDGQDLIMDAIEAQDYIKNVENRKYLSIKEEGEKFLAENKLKEGVQETASGLQYEVIKMGKGKKPATDNTVKVHYTGTLLDGTVFDSSVQRGTPAEFGVTQVIKGWTEALQLMPVGSKFKLYIPYDLAYGDRGAGEQIKPYSALIFEVELLDITK